MTKQIQTEYAQKIIDLNNEGDNWNTTNINKIIQQAQQEAVERRDKEIIKLVQSMPDITTQEFGEESISRFDLLKALQTKGGEYDQTNTDSGRLGK